MFAFKYSGRYFRAVPRSRQFNTNTRQSLVIVDDRPAPHIGTIRVLTLNRPNARNAISRSLLAALTSEIEAIEANTRSKLSPIRSLIIASASEDAFCAGADLKERETLTREQTGDFLTSLRSTFRKIAELPIPTISAVSSVALGGGLELALATRFRVFSDTVMVGLPETRLGIIPGAGGTYRLSQLIGQCHAQDLVLSGRRLRGEEAFKLGLCNKLIRVSDEKYFGEGTARQLVLDEAMKFAEQICEGGPIALRAAMAAVDLSCEEGENAQYEIVLDTRDRLEALGAFREKRKPAFGGH